MAAGRDRRSDPSISPEDDQVIIFAYCRAALAADVSSNPGIEETTEPAHMLRWRNEQVADPE